MSKPFSFLFIPEVQLALFALEIIKKCAKPMIILCLDALEQIYLFLVPHLRGLGTKRESAYTREDSSLK